MHDGGSGSIATRFIAPTWLAAAAIVLMGAVLRRDRLIVATNDNTHTYRDHCSTSLRHFTFLPLYCRFAQTFGAIHTVGEKNSFMLDFEAAYNHEFYVEKGDDKPNNHCQPSPDHNSIESIEIPKKL